MKKISIVSISLAFALLIGFVPAYAKTSSQVGSSGEKQEKTETAKKNTSIIQNVSVSPAATVTTKAQTKLARSLARGFSGDDVKALQEWLARDREVYPEGLTSGYFGALTEKAVKNFQKKHGIDQIGVVGPKTRERLEKEFSKLENKTEKAAEESDVNDSGQKGAFASTTNTLSEHKLTLCHKGKESISVGIPAIAAHLNHGDTVGACSGTATTTDKTAPTIFGVSATPSVTTATINWSTNESADSRVWFATSSPVISASGKATVFYAPLSTTHALSLSGLGTSTTYYYLVVSRDASGNTATSTEGSFTTLAAPALDTAAPFIFGASAVAGVNSASVSWFTNESANSRLWYAPALDVMASPARATVFDSSLTTSRTLNLTGLSMGTQYYFLIVSADASGNTATSTSNLYTFVTSPLSLTSVSAVPASTTATVGWQTNAGTDSVVHYATSTPVLTAPSQTSISNSAPVTSHSVGLSGLATSTLYYYLVTSKDTFGNSATSSESSFSTLAN